MENQQNEQEQKQEQPQQTQQQEQSQMQQETPTANAEAIKQADPADVEKNKTMGILAYLIFFLPLITDAKDSPFARFHANQGFVIFLAYIILSFIPFLGWMLLIVPMIFAIMGMISASKGEMKETPLIGGIHILDK